MIRDTRLLCIATAVLVLLVSISDCFPFKSDNQLKAYMDKLDRKYFPIFLRTLDMINAKEFRNLEAYFSEELLSEDRKFTISLSVQRWNHHPDIYFTPSKYPAKPYKITFPVDWAANPLIDRTWVFNFQNLLWLRYYLERGEKGDDISALIAFKVIHDWLTSNAQWPAKYGKYVYGNHSTAERLKVLYRTMRLYKKCQYRDNEFFKILLTGLANHIALMSTKKRYLNWHNHGIIFDLRLLEVLSDFSEYKMRNELL